MSTRTTNKVQSTSRPQKAGKAKRSKSSAGPLRRIAQRGTKADLRGRVTLGTEYAGQEFRVYKQPNGNLQLEPVVNITVAESWLNDNPRVLAKLQQAIEQADAGELHDLGSFLEHADDEFDD